MIKDLHENDLGDMVGTFYSDVLGYEIKVMYDKDISQKYVEKNIEYFNHLDQEFLKRICAALKCFFDDFQDMYPGIGEHISDELLENYDKDFKSILRYIDIGTYYFCEFSTDNEAIPVINLSGDCEWDGDAQITIMARNNQLVYVGTWTDINIWNDDAIARKRYNYAVPEGDD